MGMRQHTLRDHQLRGLMYKLLLTFDIFLNLLLLNSDSLQLGGCNNSFATVYRGLK